MVTAVSLEFSFNRVSYELPLTWLPFEKGSSDSDGFTVVSICWLIKSYNELEMWQPILWQKGHCAIAFYYWSFNAFLLSSPGLDLSPLMLVLLFRCFECGIETSPSLSLALQSMESTLENCERVLCDSYAWVGFYLGTPDKWRKASPRKQAALATESNR